MKGQSLKLSSTVYFCLLVLLASSIIVDAGKCSTTTTTATVEVTTTSSICTATPPPVLTCPNCRDPHKNCGDGNGHQDGKHCIVLETCTLTKTTCVTPPPVCRPSGQPCTINDFINCCSQCCIAIDRLDLNNGGECC